MRNSRSSPRRRARLLCKLPLCVAHHQLLNTMCCVPWSQAALAALSGIQEVPEPRSLLTMEEGVQVGFHFQTPSCRFIC